MNENMLDDEWLKFQETLPSITRINTLFELKSNLKSGNSPINKVDTLTIKDLNFSYDNRTPVLTNITINTNPIIRI